MSTYKYNCKKLEELRNIFDQINNKNNIAYINKYYNCPFSEEVIDIIYFGSVFNSNDFTKIPEYEILKNTENFGFDYKKYNLIPLFRSNKREFIVYNYKDSKYQMYIVGSVNEKNYDQLRADKSVVIDDLGFYYLKLIYNNFEISQVVNKKELSSLHEEYEQLSKQVYDLILENKYLNSILKTTFYFDISYKKNAIRCEKVGSEVLSIIYKVFPNKNEKNKDIVDITMQKMLFGMLDIAKIDNNVLKDYIKHLKSN